jgi:hypothetical protein
MLFSLSLENILVQVFKTVENILVQVFKTVNQLPDYLRNGADDAAFPIPPGTPIFQAVHP